MFSRLQMFLKKRIEGMMDIHLDNFGDETSENALQIEVDN